MTNVIADGIASKELSSVQVANMMKEVCDYVMHAGYMCDLHFEVDPQVKNMNCRICLDEEETKSHR